MAHLPYSIELHDSRVAELTLANGKATVRLSPAYIHRDGKGWRQNADILVEEASVESTQSEFPAGLADGRLNTTQGPYHNLLELPLHEQGAVTLTLEFFSGGVAKIQGSSAKIILYGEAAFVEDVT